MIKDAATGSESARLPHAVDAGACRWVPALVFLGTLLVVLVLSTALPPQTSAAGRGVIDHRLEWFGGVDLDAVPDLVEELGAEGLGTSWTRISVFWNRLQPDPRGTSVSTDDLDRDGYADSYVHELDTVVARLHAAGISIIMTSFDVPLWASDSRYWTDAGYDPDVAMRIDDTVVRRQFTAFAYFLADRYAYAVHHFEVWNEPNLGSGIFPQRRGTKLVAPLVYLKMLKAFSTGVRSGARDARVIAGATAPRGSNNVYSTSPQVFARYLKSEGATKWFDAYSHHPYTPRNSRNASPNLPPNNPRRCVTLGNLDVLLDVFKEKPFYLTEYGYGTKPSDVCGLLVSYADQARFLRQAYARLARWPQVKTLLWYLVADYAPNPQAPGHALYLGLCESDGVTRKPSWYAFAGSNRLTLSMPSHAAPGAAFTVYGALTTKLGALEGARVTLQSRSMTGGDWKDRESVPTSIGGSFSFTTSQTKTTRYRVVWDGVCESTAGVLTTP